MRRIPIVLVDERYWSYLINFEVLAQEGMVAPDDLELFSYASDAEGAWQELTRLGLSSGPRPPGLPSHGDP
jgi:predicted Rossmann-fold nucleotide-binding protein